MVGVTIALLADVTGFYYGTRSVLRDPNSPENAHISNRVTCPETNKQVLVRLTAGKLSNEGYRVVDRLEIADCLLWPAHKDCVRGCMKKL
jgi:hypothetical protein